MTHEIFVSYSSRDKAAADAVCAGLEARGLSCWIAPRDQSAGKSYGQQITEAIDAAKVMVLIFSDHVNNSDAVQNEIDLATNARLSVIPLRIADVAFNPELRFYLGRVHWLDAFERPVEHYLDSLAASIRLALAGKAPPPRRPEPEQPAPLPPPGPAPAASQPPPIPPPVAAAPPTLGRPGGLRSVPPIVWVVIAVVLGVGAFKLLTLKGPAPGPLTTAPVASGAPSVGTVDLPPAGPPNPQAVQYYETIVVPNGPPATLSGATLVTTQELSARLEARTAGQDAFTLVDARGCTGEPTVPGAVCLAPNTLEELQRRAPAATPLIVFCHDGSCPYSYQMASAAITAGYPTVTWYRGGINAWSAAGLPRAQFSSAAAGQ